MNNTQLNSEFEKYVDKFYSNEITIIVLLLVTCFLLTLITGILSYWYAKAFHLFLGFFPSTVLVYVLAAIRKNRLLIQFLYERENNWSDE
jgi:uncharacterized membrane protein YbhN (UPF0104 family)